MMRDWLDVIDVMGKSGLIEVYTFPHFNTTSDIQPDIWVRFNMSSMEWE